MRRASRIYRIECSASLLTYGNYLHKDFSSRRANVLVIVPPRGRLSYFHFSWNENEVASYFFFFFLLFLPYLSELLASCPLLPSVPLFFFIIFSLRDRKKSSFAQGMQSRKKEGSRGTLTIFSFAGHNYQTNCHNHYQNNCKTILITRTRSRYAFLSLILWYECIS